MPSMEFKAIQTDIVAVIFTVVSILFTSDSIFARFGGAAGYASASLGRS